MDFSPINSWGTDEITPYNPINANMYDVFLGNSDVQPQISNPLGIPPRKFPSPKMKVEKSPVVAPKVQKKEGFVGNIELTDDMLIIILLVVLIVVCVSIHNTVQRAFDAVNSLAVLLAATKNAQG